MLTKEQSGSCGKQKFIKRKEKITALGCLMAFFLVGRNPAGGHPQVTCPAPDIVTAVPVVCHPCLWFDVDDARQEESSLNTASQAQGRGGRQGGKKIIVLSVLRPRSRSYTPLVSSLGRHRGRPRRKSSCIPRIVPRLPRREARPSWDPVCWLPW
ncbi:hypothetical protein K456DRAFT_677806 [Colletotrichum gloeosporioides 23]|nr:hypothetical protein K456DRAFT_677806 [Colletotrichum gloeosporioides 23]